MKKHNQFLLGGLLMWALLAVTTLHAQDASEWKAALQEVEKTFNESEKRNLEQLKKCEEALTKKCENCFDGKKEPHLQILHYGTAKFEFGISEAKRHLSNLQISRQKIAQLSSGPVLDLLQLQALIIEGEKNVSELQEKMSKLFDQSQKLVAFENIAMQIPLTLEMIKEETSKIYGQIEAKEAELLALEHVKGALKNAREEQELVDDGSVFGE